MLAQSFDRNPLEPSDGMRFRRALPAHVLVQLMRHMARVDAFQPASMPFQTACELKEFGGQS